MPHLLFREQEGGAGVFGPAGRQTHSSGSVNQRWDRRQQLCGPTGLQNGLQEFRRQVQNRAAQYCIP